MLLLGPAFPGIFFTRVLSHAWECYRYRSNAILLPKLPLEGTRTLGRCSIIFVGKIYKLSARFALMRNILKLKLSNLKFPGIFSHPSRSNFADSKNEKTEMNIFAKLLQNGKEVGKETQLQVCLCVFSWGGKGFPRRKLCHFP